MTTLPRRTIEAIGVTGIVTTVIYVLYWQNQQATSATISLSNCSFHDVNPALSQDSMNISSVSPDPQFTIYRGTDGHLGNILFQYASLVGIATYNKRNGAFVIRNDFLSLFPHSVDPFLGCSFTVPQSTNVTKKLMSNLKKVHEYKVGRYGRDVMINLPEKDILIVGHFQSYKYFDHERREIKRRLTLNSEIITKSKSLFNNLTRGIDKSATTFIGVHIRRGDMATKFQEHNGWRLPDQRYFTEAIAYYRAKYGNIHLIVASNGVEWCKENLNLGNASFSVGNRREVDLALISGCEHVIITVGTFSWWIGYLSDGDVIYYKDFIKNNSRVDRSFSTVDFFPPHWIPIADKDL